MLAYSSPRLVCQATARRPARVLVRASASTAAAAGTSNSSSSSRARSAISATKDASVLENPNVQRTAHTGVTEYTKQQEDLTHAAAAGADAAATQQDQTGTDAPSTDDDCCEEEALLLERLDDDNEGAPTSSSQCLVALTIAMSDYCYDSGEILGPLVLEAAEECLQQHYGKHIISKISDGRLGCMYWEVAGCLYELDGGQTSGQTCVDFDFLGIVSTLATGVCEHLPLLPDGKKPTGPELYKYGVADFTVTVITPNTPQHQWVVDGWGDVHVVTGRPSARDMAYVCLELAWEGRAWDAVEGEQFSMYTDKPLPPMYLEYQPPPTC